MFVLRHSAGCVFICSCMRWAPPSPDSPWQVILRHARHVVDARWRDYQNCGGRHFDFLPPIETFAGDPELREAYARFLAADATAVMLHGGVTDEDGAVWFFPDLDEADISDMVIVALIRMRAEADVVALREPDRHEPTGPPGQRVSATPVQSNAPRIGSGRRWPRSHIRLPVATS